MSRPFPCILPRAAKSGIPRCREADQAGQAEYEPIGREGGLANRTKKKPVPDVLCLPVGEKKKVSKGLTMVVDILFLGIARESLVGPKFGASHLHKSAKLELDTKLKFACGK